VSVPWSLSKGWIAGGVFLRGIVLSLEQFRPSEDAIFCSAAGRCVKAFRFFAGR